LGAAWTLATTLTFFSNAFLRQRLLLLTPLRRALQAVQAFDHGTPTIFA
jgi:hypothetical protein